MTRIIKTPRMVEESRVVGPQAIPEPEVETVQAPEISAELLLVEARREAEQIRQQAYQDGYAQGTAAAQTALQQEWDQHFQSMLEEVEGCLRQRDRYIQQSEQDLVRLSLLIAEKILHREVQDPSYLLPLVQAALEKLVGRSKIRLFLNPVDFERTQSGQLALPFENIVPVLDPTLGTGGVRLETECGAADAAFHSQFEIIARELLEEPGLAEKAIEALHEPPTV